MVETWIRIHSLVDRADDHRRTEITVEDKSAILDAIRSLREMKRQKVPDAGYYLQVAENLRDRIQRFESTVLSKTEVSALRDAMKHMREHPKK